VRCTESYLTLREKLKNCDQDSVSAYIPFRYNTLESLGAKQLMHASEGSIVQQNNINNNINDGQ